MTSSDYMFTVTANFTADPVSRVLRFWAETLGLGAPRVESSPYNQVLQSLLDPGSTLASRTPGVNFILIRLEDWGRNQDRDHYAETIRATASEFMTAVTDFVRRSKRPSIVCL